MQIRPIIIHDLHSLSFYLFTACIVTMLIEEKLGAVVTLRLLLIFLFSFFFKFYFLFLRKFKLFSGPDGLEKKPTVD